MRALALVALTGCSYVFVDRPPRPPPTEGRVDCTDSELAPDLDMGVAVVGGLAGGAVGGYLGANLAVHQLDNGGYGALLLAPYALAIGAVVGAAVGALLGGGIPALSARHGFQDVAACRQVPWLQSEARRAHGLEAAPAPPQIGPPIAPTFPTYSGPPSAP
jgi:hypothetical protein